LTAFGSESIKNLPISPLVVWIIWSAFLLSALSPNKICGDDFVWCKYLSVKGTRRWSGIETGRVHWFLLVGYLCP
jgi:hypothetical protein